MSKLLIPSMAADIKKIRHHDTIMLFRHKEHHPFAMRAPLDYEIRPLPETEEDVLYENADIRVSKQERNIYCSIKRTNAPYAAISMLDHNITNDTLCTIKNYFSQINALDLSSFSMQTSFSALEHLICSVADYCGCLTSINAPEAVERIEEDCSIYGTPSLAIALPTVCLLYRRLSALRGFNFKLIFPREIPGLAFSARILSENISALEDIPEYTALEELDCGGSIIVSARLVRLPVDDGEAISRLNILLIPQTSDPRGVLRAPEWKRQTLDSLKSLDIDIPGIF